MKTLVCRTADIAGSSKLRSLVAYAVCLCLPFLLYWSSFAAWLGLDVPLFLQQAVLYTPVEYFSDPDAYQLISTANLTPWLTLSFDLDYRLFGVNVVAFRIHQLLSISASLIAIYLLLRQLACARFESLIAAVFIAGSPPMVAIAFGLNMRHYTEGLLLSVLGVICYLRSADSPARDSWLLLSSALYLVSMSAKEVFATIPLLLLLSRPFSWRQAWTIRYHAAAALVYLVWRRYMLGEFVAGYEKDFDVTAADYLSMLMAVPGMAFRDILVLAPLAALCLFVFISNVGQRYRQLPLLAAGIACALLPLFPLAYKYKLQSQMHPRWFLLLTVFVLIFITVGLSRLQSPRARQTAFALLAIITLAQVATVTLPAIEKTVAGYGHQDRLSRFFWEEPPDRHLVTGDKWDFFLQSFHPPALGFTRELLGMGRAPVVMVDPVLSHWVEFNGQALAYTGLGFVPATPAKATEPALLDAMEQAALEELIRMRGRALQWDLRDLSAASGKIMVLGPSRQLFLELSAQGNYPIFAWACRFAGVDLTQSPVVVGIQREGVWLYSEPFLLDGREIHARYRFSPQGERGPSSGLDQEDSKTE